MMRVRGQERLVREGLVLRRRLAGRGIRDIRGVIIANILSLVRDGVKEARPEEMILQMLQHRQAIRMRAM